MAVRLPLLIASAVLLLAASVQAAPRPSCLKCHPAHYRELGSCVFCHRGDARSDRIGIAHHGLLAARFSWHAVAGSAPVERGRRLLDAFACRRCHSVAGKGNRLASDLDRLPAGTGAEAIFASIESPAQMMPRFRLDDRQITDLVNAILASAAKPGGKEAPQVVHFEPDGKREGVFEGKCGPCHRMLSARGAFGKGDIGPNLSGLFSDFYPPTAEGKKRWTAGALKDWLKNPRQSRPVTQMRPAPLTPADLERLISVELR